MANLRSCFSDASTMNQVREDLRNMRQQEKESVMVYAYQWDRALVRSSAIHPEDESIHMLSKILFHHYSAISEIK